MLSKLIRDFFVFFVVVILVYVLVIKFPKTGEVDFVNTVLSLATFLFGIFVAFSVSDRHNRISKIRDNGAIERAELTSIYHFTKIFKPEIKKKIIKTIDEYLMTSLDYKIEDYSMTEESYRKVVDVVVGLKGQTPEQKDLYDDLVNMAARVSQARKETVEIVEDRISKTEWSIFVALALVIIVSLVLINDSQTTGLTVLSTFLSATVVAVLYWLYKLDSLSWKEEQIVFEPFQKTFESLGLMRYYPEALIQAGRVENHLKYDHRVAHFPNPYPDLSGKKIEIVRLKNPSI